MKTIVKFICSNCNEIDRKEFWGINTPSKDFDNIKNDIMRKHKSEDKCNGEIEITTELISPSIYIDKIVAYYNYYREFILGEVLRKKTYENKEYYYTTDKHIGSYCEINLDVKYNYIGTMKDELILSNFYQLAFIDEFAYIQMGYIDKIISVKVGDKVKNYIIFRNGNSFEICDIRKLSDFIKDFDKFNFKEEIDPIEKAKIINQIKEYRKFRNYWIKKYYKVK